jgi:NADH:ubiquinone oxidoreductase subunit 5 (subunit L)/multisubunit Na+/H+ antiporter MnhA subunit
MAMMQHELKRLLSFHAVSQVGYMVLGVGTGVPAGIVGGLFHMVNHATYKSLLFLAGGAVQTRTGDLDLDRLGGLSKAMPLTFASFVVGALAISGVPPLNGFVSKWLVYQGVLEGGGSLMPLLLGAAVAGSALTLASFVKAIHSVFLGNRSPEVKQLSPQPREVGRSMLLPMGTLSVLCIALGLGSAVVVGGFLAPSYLRLEGLHVGDLAYGGPAALVLGTGSWVPLAAALMLLLGLGLGVVFYAAGRAFRVRRTRSFIGGETTTPASTHVSGTGFYLTFRNLPVIRGFYDNAESEAFDVYRLGGQYGSRVVEVLRSLHTGVLETYVTWVLAGAAAIVLLLFALL